MSSKKNILFYLSMLLLLLAGVIFLVVTNVRIKNQREKMTSRIESLKKEIQLLEQKNQEAKEFYLKYGFEASLIDEFPVGVLKQ